MAYYTISYNSCHVGFRVNKRSKLFFTTIQVEDFMIHDLLTQSLTNSPYYQTDVISNFHFTVYITCLSIPGPQIGLTSKQETKPKSGRRRAFLHFHWQFTVYHYTSWGQGPFIFWLSYGLLTIWFSLQIVQQSDHFQNMITVSHNILWNVGISYDVYVNILYANHS